MDTFKKNSLNSQDKYRISKTYKKKKDKIKTVLRQRNYYDAHKNATLYLWTSFTLLFYHRNKIIRNWNFV